ncbi:MAG: hypothetical protein WDW21_00715 [Neisseriaceae bacterium]
MNNKKLNFMLSYLATLLVSTAPFAKDLAHSPEDTVNSLLHLLIKQMDFDRLLALGDFPRGYSRSSLDFQLLEMRKLIPQEGSLFAAGQPCTLLQQHLRQHPNGNYPFYHLERSSCVKQMNQLGTKSIAQAYGLEKGLYLTRISYNPSHCRAILTYRTHSDHRALQFPLVRRKKSWYLEELSYATLVNILGYR